MFKRWRGIQYTRNKIRNFFGRIHNRRYLKDYFSEKQNGPIMDIFVGTYYNRLRKTDIDTMLINVTVDKYDLRVRLIYIEEMNQYYTKGVGFEVVGLVGEKDIFQCEDFKEFAKLYGEVILFLEKNYDKITNLTIGLWRYQN